MGAGASKPGAGATNRQQDPTAERLLPPAEYGCANSCEPRLSQQSARAKARIEGTGPKLMGHRNSGYRSSGGRSDHVTEIRFKLFGFLQQNFANW